MVTATVAPTIVALASGRPPVAIAVIRISGTLAFEAVRRLCDRDGPAPRRMALRTLRDPGDGGVLDRALVVVFPGPASATGEDLAELHLHGGTAVVAGVIGALAVLPGVRLAEPGEFTRRAFDNGRLDLSQVEGLADLVAAETATQRSQALGLAGGALGRMAEGLRDRAVDLLATAEAELDFSEDEADVAAGLSRDRSVPLEALIADIDALLADATRAARLRDGLAIAVVGAPNVGKSSLVNALAMRDVAIVTPFAGTTRDIIEVPLDLGGIAAQLIDTAGLRDSDEPIEQEGIRRARQRAASADLVLHIVESMPSQPLGLVVLNKTDLGTVVPPGVIGVSALRGDGLGTLRQHLADWAAELVRPGQPALLGHMRHREAFLDARSFLVEALTATDAVLVAAALRLAVRALGRISGRIGVEDVLGVIFSRFCVGK